MKNTSKNKKAITKVSENLNISDVNDRKIIHETDKYTLDRNEMLYMFGWYLNELDESKLLELWKNMKLDDWLKDKK